MLRILIFRAQFARLATPPNKKLRKSSPKKFGSLYRQTLTAKNALNDALLFPAVIDLSDSTGHMTEDTDGCDKQAYCSLL